MNLNLKFKFKFEFEPMKYNLANMPNFIKFGGKVLAGNMVKCVPCVCKRNILGYSTWSR